MNIYRQFPVGRILFYIVASKPDATVHLFVTEYIRQELSIFPVPNELGVYRATVHFRYPGKYLLTIYENGVRTAALIAEVV